MPNLQPNTYHLHNADGTLKVDYETSSFIGQPTLNLTQGPSHTTPIRHFSGSQIRAVSTEIGTLVSVTTRMTIDSGSTSFSFLLPAISLANISDRQTFDTEAIVTTHSGPIPVPAAGVHERYQFIPLTGEANFNFFLLESLAEPLSKAAV